MEAQKLGGNRGQAAGHAFAPGEGHSVAVSVFCDDAGEDEAVLVGQKRLEKRCITLSEEFHDVADAQFNDAPLERFTQGSVADDADAEVATFLHELADGFDQDVEALDLDETAGADESKWLVGVVGAGGEAVDVDAVG